MLDNTVTPTTDCPLGPLDRHERVIFGFYVPRHMRGLPDDEPDEGQLSWQELEPIRNGAAKCIDLRGERWIRIDSPKANWLVMKGHSSGRTHVHTSFDAFEHHFHLDYVRFVSNGPMAVAAEILVFMDGKLMTRGGFFGCAPVSPCYRNMPLFLRVGTFALSISHLLKLDKDAVKGAVVGFDGLGLWTLDSSRH